MVVYDSGVGRSRGCVETFVAKSVVRVVVRVAVKGAGYCMVWSKCDQPAGVNPAPGTFHNRRLGFRFVACIVVLATDNASVLAFLACGVSDSKQMCARASMSSRNSSTACLIA